MKTSDQFKLKFSAAILCFGLLVLVVYSVLKHPGQDHSAKNYKVAATAKTTTTTSTLMSSDYNETIANHSLMLALLTYCDEDLVEGWSCPYCGSVKNFKLYKYVKGGLKGDALVAIVGYDATYQQIVVAFRGSSNTANWLTNLQFWQMDYPGVSGGRVHFGFYHNWKDLKDDVISGYKEVLADYPQSQVLISGHSLGGAIGALAFLELREIYSDDSSVYPKAFYLHTFGQPRWANPTMASYFSELIDFHWRVVFLHDIVPQVPPDFLDYRHSGQHIWYWCNYPMSYYMCDSSTKEDPKCGYPAGNVHDHMHYFNSQFLCSSGQSPPEPPFLPIVCTPNPNI